MRTDIEKKVQWYLTCAARSTGGKKRVAGLVLSKVGTRFNTVAADIFGPVTLATRTTAKPILVVTDLLTKYVVAVPLVSTDSAEVAREIVENWVRNNWERTYLLRIEGKAEKDIFSYFMTLN